MASVNVVGTHRVAAGSVNVVRTASEVMSPPDDYDMDPMEPDIATTSHMAFVDGRCACCPYGFHIDLDFLRYLDSLGKSGASSTSLSNLRMIHQQKKKLRKSMEVYFRQQELSAADPKRSLASRDHEDEEARRLLSMVEREESLTSKVLDEFDSTINEQFSSRTSSSVPIDSRSGRKSIDDSQRYYSEAKVTLTRPPPGVGGSYLTTDYDSSSSVSISSGPPSPGLHMSHTASHLEASILSSAGSQTPSSTRDVAPVTSSVKRDVVTSNGESVMRKMVTTTTTKSVTSAADPGAASSETVVLVDGTSVPPGMTLISAATLQTIREQMAACLQRLKELEEENKALNTLQVRMSVLKEEKKMLDLQHKAQQDLLAARSAKEKQYEQELKAARSAIEKLTEQNLLATRSAVEKRTIGVGDCTLNDSFMPENEKFLHRSPNGDFTSDIQVIRKINLESMVSPRSAPPPVPKKPCRSIGVGDGNVFITEVAPVSVALSTTTAQFQEIPPVVRVHEKELSTDQKTEIHEKEVKMVFLERNSETSLFGDKPQIAPKPKPLTRSIGVGSGNVFETNQSESENYQLHEKELRTVFIGGDDSSQKERKVTRNVGILCKAAMRDVGVMYHQEDEAPMTRNVAVGVNEIGFNEQGMFGSMDSGERSDTSIHVTNTALQQLNMAAFQSRHLRITNEQLQQVLDLMLKKNLRSVGVQCRFATVDQSVSATGNGNGTGVNQVTVGCSDDTVDVDVVPVRQWRSIGVDNRPSVFHRASGADVVYRVDSSTNTQTQGIRLERATNTDSVTRYPAATNTDPALPGESIATETESVIFHGMSAQLDVMTNTEELFCGSVPSQPPLDITSEAHYDSVPADTKGSLALSSQSTTVVHSDNVPAANKLSGTVSSQSVTVVHSDSIPAATKGSLALSSQSTTVVQSDSVPAATKLSGAVSSQSVTLRSGGKARSTDYRTSRDLLTLGILPAAESEDLVSSVTSLGTSNSTSEHGSAILTTSLPTMATPSVHFTRVEGNIDGSISSSSLPEVALKNRTSSAPTVAASCEFSASSDILSSSMASSGSDVLLTSPTGRPMDESSDGSVDTLCSVVWRGDASDSPVSRRVYSTHTSRGIRSAPADIDVLPHTSHRLVTLDQEGNILTTEELDKSTVEPTTSIKVYETITEVRRAAPEGSTSYVTSSISDGHVTTSRDIDGSLRSIMKSSSSSPIARRRKEISFVDNIFVSNDTGSMGDVDMGGVSGSDDSRRSSASYEEGTYDGRHGNVVYSCKDDSSTTTQMFDQHFRETYELSPEMLASCMKYAQWLDDSTGVTAKELNASLAVVQQEWFNVSSHKLTNPSQVDDYMTSINGISRNLLEHIVNMADTNGNSALHYAVSHGNFEVVGLLLDTEVIDVNLPNRAGYTAIMLASLADVQTDRQRDIVQRLFHSGNVNLRATQAGQTALMLAVSHGKIDLAQMLINAGADVNVQDEDGSTALMCASEHGHIDIVKLLLAQPTCDVTLTDNDDSTAMSIAMEAGHRDIGVLLYAHVNFRPGSPKLKKKVATRGSVSPTKK